jgi:hypothetical protein
MRGVFMPASATPGNDPTGSDLAARNFDNAAIELVMREVPRGALALSGLTVGLLLLAWFLIYVLVFLPRGMVG